MLQIEREFVLMFTRVWRLPMPKSERDVVEESIVSARKRLQNPSHDTDIVKVKKRVVLIPI
jgi:hypothetical protein